jgi:hypothetical protein
MTGANTSGRGGLGFVIGLLIALALIVLGILGLLQNAARDMPWTSVRAVLSAVMILLGAWRLYVALKKR